MRKAVLILTTVTLIVFAPAAIAADGPPQPVQVVATVLQLDDRQVASWMQILVARQQAIDPLIQQVAAINAQSAVQFEQLLTPDQRLRLQQIRAASLVCPVVPAFAATGVLGYMPDSNASTSAK